MKTKLFEDRMTEIEGEKCQERYQQTEVGPPYLGTAIILTCR